MCSFDLSAKHAFLADPREWKCPKSSHFLSSVLHRPEWMNDETWQTLHCPRFFHFGLWHWHWHDCGFGWRINWLGILFTVLPTAPRIMPSRAHTVPVVIRRCQNIGCPSMTCMYGTVHPVLYRTVPYRAHVRSWATQHIRSVASLEPQRTGSPISFLLFFFFFHPLHAAIPFWTWLPPSFVPFPSPVRLSPEGPWYSPRWSPFRISRRDIPSFTEYSVHTPLPPFSWACTRYGTVRYPGYIHRLATPSGYPRAWKNYSISQLSQSPIFQVDRTDRGSNYLRTVQLYCTVLYRTYSTVLNTGGSDYLLHWPGDWQYRTFPLPYRTYRTSVRFVFPPP